MFFEVFYCLPITEFVAGIENYVLECGILHFGCQLSWFDIYSLYIHVLFELCPYCPLRGSTIDSNVSYV